MISTDVHETIRGWLASFESYLKTIPVGTNHQQPKEETFTRESPDPELLNTLKEILARLEAIQTLLEHDRPGSWGARETTLPTPSARRK